MIITLEMWNNYFNLSLSNLPFGVREEENSLTFFYSNLPNLPKYESITNEYQKKHFEYALMEQVNYIIKNIDLLNGKVVSSGGFSIEGYSESGISKDNAVNINSTLKKFNPTAYDYLNICGYTYMGLGGCDC